MNKKLVLALMLASGMALAQSSGSSPGSSDQQQPSTQQPSSQQPSTQPQQPSSQSPTSAGQSSLTGCLKGSDGNWVLVAEGQSTPVKGDSSTLSPHNGHQVQVKGSQASDGSFQVTDVIMISETCTKQDASSSGAGAAAGAATGAASSAADATKSAAGDAANATKNAASDAAQATKSAASDSTSSAQSAPAPKTYSDETPSQSTSQSAGAGKTAGQSASQSSGQKLPQTASPLPLLGLLGFASLVSGLIARRK